MRKARFLAWGLVGLGVAAAGYAALARGESERPGKAPEQSAQKPQQPPKMPPAQVVTARVVEKEVASAQTFVATVWPVRASQVGSAVSGRVEVFYVEEGTRVREGQPIAKMRTRLVEAELAAAEGTLATRRAELAELENGSRPEEIAQAKAKAENARVQRNYYAGVRRRLEALARGSIGREEFEKAVQDAQASEAALAEAEAALKLVELGPRKEKIAQARGMLEQAKAEVERLAEQVERHTVVAPFDGYVMAEHAEEGQWLLQGQLVAEIQELDEVDVQAEVLEDYISGISVGDSVPVKVPSLGDRSFVGTVSAILPRANPRARTFPVRVRVQNERIGMGVPIPTAAAVGLLATRDGGLAATVNLAGAPGYGITVLLKTGMFARATFPVGRKEKMLLVHKDALVLGGPKPIVYAVGPDGNAVAVPVALGIADGPLVQVIGDLKAGQKVVVVGNERLRPGQPLTVVSAE